jgi:putative redox protein
MTLLGDDVAGGAGRQAGAFSARYTLGREVATAAGAARMEDEMARSSPVTLTWKGEGLLFGAKTAHGAVDLASRLDEPGNGVTPMELLATALGGCTAMDVASILIKMRQPLEAFSVEVGGERAEEHPRKFTSIEVVYRLKGDLDERKVQRAISLSEEKYCSVEATLRPALPITSRYEIER